MREMCVLLVGAVALAVAGAALAQMDGGTFPAPCIDLPANRTPDDGDPTNDGGWLLVNFCFNDPRPFCNSNDDFTSSVDLLLGGPLQFPFTFYGLPVPSVFINNNGNLSFGAGLNSFDPGSFPLTTPLVAPFWADVDTGRVDSPLTPLGHVWYQEVGQNTFAVAWDNVGYRNQNPGMNTFQVLISDGSNAAMGPNNVCFCYDAMDWTTGDSSGGVGGFPDPLLGGSPAIVGANAGNGTDFFPIGEFDRPGVAFDGPGGDGDGVEFLNGRAICFDVSSPSIVHPPAPTAGWAEAVAVRQDPGAGVFAFVAAQEAGLLVYDATDPTNLAGPIGSFVPSPSQCPEGFFADEVTLRDDGAGPEAILSAGPCGLVGVDVSDPRNPAFLGRVDLQPPSGLAIWAKDVVHTGPSSDYLYAAEYFDGLQIVDLSANPEAVIATFGPADDPGFGNAIAVAVDPGETRAYVATTTGLRVVDITAKSSPVGLPGFAVQNAAGTAIPQDVLVSGSFAYLPVFEGGLRVLDLGAGGPPVQIQALAPGRPYYKVATDGSRVVVTQGQAGVKAFTVKGDGMLMDQLEVDAGDRLADSPLAPAFAWNVAVDAGRVYVTLGDPEPDVPPNTGRLQIIDFPAPSPIAAPDDGTGGRGASLAAADEASRGPTARFAEHLGMPTVRERARRPIEDRSPDAVPAPREMPSRQATRQRVARERVARSGAAGIASAPRSLERSASAPAEAPVRAVSSPPDPTRSVAPHAAWRSVAASHPRGRGPAPEDSAQARPAPRERVAAPPDGLGSAARADAGPTPGRSTPVAAGVASGLLLTSLSWLVWRRRVRRRELGAPPTRAST